MPISLIFLRFIIPKYKKNISDIYKGTIPSGKLAKPTLEILIINNMNFQWLFSIYFLKDILN